MMHVAYPFYVEPCGVHNFLIRSESSAYQPLRLKIYKKHERENGSFKREGKRRQSKEIADGRIIFDIVRIGRGRACKIQTRQKTTYRLRPTLDVGRQPLQTLVKSITRSGTCSLDIPRSLPKRL